MKRWFVDRLPQRGIPSVSLRRLLPGARFVGCHDWEVSGCTADSRRLDPGQVFVAVRGARRDGHDFVAQALERGAAGVVVERPCPEAGRLQVIVDDSRAAFARLCHALAGDPSERLLVVGVAGTLGKGATGLFVRSIFEANGARFGQVGASGWSDGVVTRPVGGTVAEAPSLAAMLAEMVERRCDGGVIEIPVEALAGRGIEAIGFDAVAVTDLGGLTEGASGEARARCREMARLVRKVVPGGSVIVNADDPLAERLGAVNLDARRVSFALKAPADVTAKIERLDARGSQFLLRGFGREAAVELAPIGRGHVSQALAAAAVAWSLGVEIGAVVAGLEAVTYVPGRLQAVGGGQDFEVRIDEARSGAELEQALAMLREVGVRRIHCLLGAEGYHNRALRLGLARAAETGADHVILTTDNPRTEDPDEILDDLLAGLRRPGRVQVEPDRRRAIGCALASAAPGDAVLIVGKSQPSFQIFADRAVPFDDRAVIADWLRSRGPSSRRSSA